MTVSSPSSPQTGAAAPAPERSGPWWRHGHMWLVVGGPLVVVLASFYTLYLAIKTPDPVYSDKQRRPNAATSAEEGFGLAPAMQARNHAATGVLPGAAPAAQAASAAEGGH